ncbi:uncharacterized protein K02A2.6-like [Sitophilus oryzae]|uniref:Uncharacterized protein K02A2.6-like n=1 Tax=Sitophilus oryzae TaxID=7048 RepID=A0A6J2XVJ8_SITOR|nr:uncharacterized protein K02A2.6-like [Sitophilus oryzae]
MREETELRRLLDDGILSPVSHSDWATPIVPVIKSGGGIRICGDFKITLNPVLHVDQYPLPRIDELFSKLRGGLEFTQIDLSNAYQQVKLNPESKLLTTINTHKGLFVYNRLPFGIANAPAIFQGIMEKILSGIEGVACFIDDILIIGETREKHINRVNKVLKRLENNGLTISINKCNFFKESVTYLGYKIDKHGLHICEDKIKAILEAPIPQDVKQTIIHSARDKLISMLGLSLGLKMADTLELAHQSNHGRGNKVAECEMYSALSFAARLVIGLIIVELP